MRPRDHSSRAKKPFRSPLVNTPECIRYECQGAIEQAKRKEAATDEVANKNVKKITGQTGISDFTLESTHSLYKGETFVGTQEDYRTKAIVNWQNGEIIAIGPEDRIDMSVRYAKDAVELEIELAATFPQFETVESKKSELDFTIVGPVDPERGVQLPLDTRLMPEALQAIEKTIAGLNDPAIRG